MKSFFFLVLTGCFSVFSSWAQPYPNKPVRLISGPGPDIAARLMANQLSPKWGQQIIPETLAAASGKVAAETVLKAKADGYTLLNATSSFQISHALGIHGVDVVSELTPVIMTNVLPFILVVPAQAPFKNVAELIAKAKSSPQSLNYASGGNGTLPHLAAETFKSLAKVDLIHVPFKTADQAALSVASGQVEMMFTSYPVVKGLVESGKLKILATTAAKRLEVLPDVPAMVELGFTEFSFISWTCIFAPIGTPPAVLSKIQADVRLALNSEELKKQYRQLGFELPSEEHMDEKLLSFLKKDSQKLNAILKSSQVKID
jgi:tripartite-type tricarboxylate transporter receptor subunit TctC